MPSVTSIYPGIAPSQAPVTAAGAVRSVNGRGGAVVLTADDVGLADAKFRETVSVTDYGATGDGATDDSAAIQAAISYVLTLSRGGDVLFPAGTFIIGTQITIPKTSGKRVRLIGSVGSAVKNTSALSDHMFYVGSASAGGGSGVTFEGINFVGANTTSSRCVELENGNVTAFLNCSFTSVYLGVEMVTSYAVFFSQCTWNTNTVYSIYSSTTAHHMVVTDCRFYNTGTGSTYTVRIDVASDNIVLRDNVAETGWCFFAMPGGTAVTMEGNYIEYFSNTPFFFGAAIKGISIAQNWIALSGSLALGNLQGGEFANNKMYNQTVTVAGTVTDLLWSGNAHTGTGAIAYSGRVTIGPTKLPALVNAADDAAAAAAGVALDQVYRNGSILMIRVA